MWGSKLLGPEPRAQLRPAPRRGAALDLRLLGRGTVERRPRLTRRGRGPRRRRAAEQNPDLDAVVVATHVPSHAELAQRVLEAGKHCFVEKPLAQSVAEAERVLAAAEESGRTLMVGHLLEYHPGLEKLKEIADSGDLGDIHYIYSEPAEPRASCAPTRTRSGGSARTTSPWCCAWPARSRPRSRRWARATCGRGRGRGVLLPALPVGARPRTCTCRGSTRTRSGRFTVVGSKRMATFDDMELERKVTVYDKGFDEDFSSYGEYIARSGDIVEPADLERGAAADRVPPLRRMHPRGQGAAFRPGERRARRARARGAAALARGDLACCTRLTARRGCCSARSGAARRRGARRQRRDPRGHGGGRRRPDPGRRGARQALAFGPRSKRVA